MDEEVTQKTIVMEKVVHFRGLDLPLSYHPF